MCTGLAFRVPGDFPNRKESEIIWQIRRYTSVIQFSTQQLLNQLQGNIVKHSYSKHPLSSLSNLAAHVSVNSDEMR